MEKEYPLTGLCLAFAVSRSGYYAWCARKPLAHQQANRQLWQKSRPCGKAKKPVTAVRA